MDSPENTLMNMKYGGVKHLKSPKTPAFGKYLGVKTYPKSQLDEDLIKEKPKNPLASNAIFSKLVKTVNRSVPKQKKQSLRLQALKESVMEHETTQPQSSDMSMSKVKNISPLKYGFVTKMTTISTMFNNKPALYNSAQYKNSFLSIVQDVKNNIAPGMQFLNQYYSNIQQLLNQYSYTPTGVVTGSPSVSTRSTPNPESSSKQGLQYAFEKAKSDLTKLLNLNKVKPGKPQTVSSIEKKLKEIQVALSRSMYELNTYLQQINMIEKTMKEQDEMVDETSALFSNFTMGGKSAKYTNDVN